MKTLNDELSEVIAQVEEYKKLVMEEGKHVTPQEGVISAIVFELANIRLRLCRLEGGN